MYICSRYVERGGDTVTINSAEAEITMHLKANSDLSIY